MSQVTKKKVNLQFASTGLDEIGKALEKAVPFLTKKGAQESMGKLTSEIATLKSILEKNNFEMTEESAQSFQKTYERVIKDAANMRKHLFDIQDKEMSARQSQIESTIESLEKKIDLKKETLRSSERRVTTKDDGTLSITKAFRKEQFDRFTNTQSGGQFYGVSGNAVQYEAYLKSVPKMQEALAAMNLTELEREQILTRQRVLTREEEESLNKIMREKRIQMEAEQMIDQLVRSRAIENATNVKAQEELAFQALEIAEINKDELKIQELKTELKKLEMEYAEKIKKEGGSEELLKSREEIYETSEKNLQANRKATDELAKSQTAAAHTTGQMRVEVKKASSDIGQAAKNVFSYGLAFQFLRRIYRETIRTVKDLDQALTEMSVVTSMSRKESWALLGTFQNLARETGFTTTEIAKLSTVYFRQGRTLKDVIELTRVAAQSARVAGISAVESANYLTAAVNGFGLAAKEAELVADKFAALAASSASSYEELAVGLSKFASQAKIAGLEMDFALGLLAKGVETTREAPESIGTALKTVLARMRELTDLGKTFEDGMDVNRVEVALRQIGVALRDSSGQFRDMQEVITEVGYTWDTLNKNQQASVAVALAGTRQQSRLIAMFEDFDRTMQLVEISQESAGAMTAQHAEYMKGMEAAMINLQNAWQQFITTVTDSEFIIFIVKGIAGALDLLVKILKSFGIVGKNAMIIMMSLTFWLKLKNSQILLSVKALSAYIKTATAASVTNKGLTASTALASGAFSKLGAAITLFFAKIGPVGWVILALGAIATALAVVSSRTKKTLEEINRQNKIENYELNKKNRTLSGIAEEYDKISKKRIKTEVDMETLNELSEQLSEIDSKLAVFDFRGELDIEATIANIERSIGINKAKINNSLRDGLNTAFKEISRGKGSKKEQVTAISDYTVKMMEDAGASRELEWAIRNFVENNYEQMAKAFKNTGGFEKYLMEQTANFIAEYEKSFNAIEGVVAKKGQSRFEMQYEEFVRQIKEGSAQTVDALRSSYDMFAFLMDSFSGENGTRGKMPEGFAEYFGMLNLTITEINELEYHASRLGKDFMSGLVVAYEDYLKLVDSGVSPTQAQAASLSRLSSSFDDATMKMEIFGIINRKTIQNLVQDAETAQSAIDRFNEGQQKFLKGELVGSDLHRFMDDFSHVFEVSGNFQKFASGSFVALNTETANLQDSTESLIAQYQTLIDQIYDPRTENIESVRAQLAMVQAALSYKGALSNLTFEQIRYNNELRQYNLLTKTGIEDIEAKKRLVDVMTTATYHTISQSEKKIADLRKEMQDFYGESSEGLLEVINGVVQISEEALSRGLELSILEDYANRYQGFMDDMSNMTASLVQERIELAQMESDKKRKIYENYFKAMDRLENRETTEKDKENILKQLQRLEGATDERSREKAKQLRADLIKIEETERKTLQAESREDLFKSLEDEMDMVKKEWNDVYTGIIQSGAASAMEFLRLLRDADLITDEQYNNMLNSNTENAVKNDIKVQTPGRLDVSDAYVDDPGTTDNHVIQGALREVANDAFEKWGIGINQDFVDHAMSKYKGIRKLDYNQIYQELTQDFLNDLNMNKKFRGQLQGTAINLPAFKKGGLVDFTGAAMLHGSKSSPEMVLNAQQTEMFFGLRDALSKISLDVSGGSSSSVTIENITIKTDHLNNNQDFDRAGKALAEAFGVAIGKRGLSVNTKR